MVEMAWVFGLLLLICDFVEPMIYHRRNREMLEGLCIKESPWKTYFDAVVTNVFVSLPFILGFLVIAVLIEVFV